MGWPGGLIHLSQSLGIEDEPPFNLYTELKKEILQEGGQLSKAIAHTATGIDVIPASIDLAIVKFDGKVFQTVIHTNIQLARQLAGELMRRSYSGRIERRQVMEAAMG